MDEKLKNYLKKCNPATVDPSIFDDLRDAMKQAVPEIAESIRHRERLAAHLRTAASKPSQSNTGKQD